MRSEINGDLNSGQSPRGDKLPAPSAASGYPWPPVPRLHGAVSWRGDVFLVGSKLLLPYLAYSETNSAWSDELTGLHEERAGSTHPIEVASRQLAIDSMRLLGGAPVILDVGCSSGFLLQELRDHMPAAQLVGADYLSGVVKKASARNPGIPFVQFDLRECPLPGNSLDGITALNVLEHIDDDQKALGHIHRILRPGGIAHIEVPAGPSSFDMYDEVLLHHRRYRLPELEKRVRDLGFRVEKATHLGFLLYPLFKLAKLRNRYIGRHLDSDRKQALVAQQIGRTAGSRWMRAALALEYKLGKRASFPFGIRCILRLRKQG
ncbi:MAG: class I SAM-dependent methyltransferase [Verrucomicrobia bacterium]|nr:class I SAM-dependent methyltransferase [Verrucomicrobiota bacterium]